MKVIIFGTGKYYGIYRNNISEKDVVAIVDNNPMKIGTFLDGKKIIAPAEIVDYQFDYIFILVRKSEEIFKQLLLMGVPKHKIKTYGECGLFSKNREVFFPAIRRENKKRIIIVTVDLEYEGVAMCVRMCSDVLLRNNNRVTVISMNGGPLKEELVELGATVVIDPAFHLKNVEDYDETRGASLIIVNTIVLFHVLKNVHTSIPIMWWIHESKMSFEGVVYPEIMTDVDYSNIYIYAVSEYAKKHIGSVITGRSIDVLMLGIEDGFSSEKRRQQKLMFITVGKMCARKGQDILVDALRKVDSSVLNGSRFILVGDDSDEGFVGTLREKVKRNKLPVEFRGQLSNSDVLQLLEEADGLICPSREETVSIAVIEALRAGRIVITSSETGVASYLKNGENAYIFESENAEELAKAIEYIYWNCEKSDEVAQNGKKVFARVFSEKQFENRFLKEVEKIVHAVR